jgi:hypothetical protein
MKKIGSILMAFGLVACGASRAGQTKDFGGDLVGNGDPMGVVRGIIETPDVNANMIAMVSVEIHPFADAPAEVIASKQVSVSSVETSFEVLAPMGLGEQLYARVEIRDAGKLDGEICYLATQSYPVGQDSDFDAHRIALRKVSNVCDDDNVQAQNVDLDLTGRRYERQICEQSSGEQNCIEFIEFGTDGRVSALLGGDDIVMVGQVSVTFENLVEINFGSGDFFLSLVISPDLTKAYVRENAKIVYRLK